MKKQEVRRIVEGNIERLKKNLGLDSWRVLVDYGPAIIDGIHYAGKCTTDPDLFETALITLAPKQLNNSAEVTDTLTHELAHCIASYFDICQSVLSELLPKNEYRAMRRLFGIAHEKTALSIQSVLKASAE